MPTSKAEWVGRARAVVATVRTLGPEEFFDEENLRYHGVCNEVAVLAHSFALDIDAFRRFLHQWSGPKRWLPVSPDDLRTMSATDILFRLKSNIADERWVDGALVDPFRSGTLVAALERLIAEIDGIDLQRA